MTTELDERLRAALHAIPEKAPPAGIAVTALARARRRHRHAVTGMVLLVAVLAGAAVTVPTLVLHPAPTRTQIASGPALGRFVVAGFASRDPRETTTGLGRYELYQASTNGYAVVPGRRAVPSPDGRTVALISGQGKLGLVPADRVLDPRAVRWVPDSGPVHVPASDVLWSPDSRHVLVPTYSQLRSHMLTSNALAVDAATLAVRELRVSRGSVAGKPVGRLVFGPRSDAIAKTDYYASKTGSLFPDLPFSPSGYLLAGCAAGRSTVIDIASRRTLGTVDGQVAGWYDEDHLVVLSGRSVRVVDYRSGRVLVERPLTPAGRLLTGVWLAPAHGAAPPGAIVL